MKSFYGLILFYLAWMIAAGGFWYAVAYVAVHFIRKFW